MTAWQGVRIAIRALRVNMLRSVLTMLGIIIGVGAVIALMAVGQGSQKAVADRIQNLGTNLVFVYLAAGLVAVFGYAYLRIAQDPERFRPFIELGVIGKLLAVGAVTWPWLTGEVGWQLPLVVSGDAVFALLFIDFLRRTRRA